MADFLGLRFVHPSDVETMVFDWGTIKWMSEPRVTHTSGSTMGVVLVEPGKGHVRHNHPGCEEIPLRRVGARQPDDRHQWRTMGTGGRRRHGSHPRRCFPRHGQHRLGAIKADCGLLSAWSRSHSPHPAGLQIASSR
jgi:hypothetical protein